MFSGSIRKENNTHKYNFATYKTSSLNLNGKVQIEAVRYETPTGEYEDYGLL